MLHSSAQVIDRGHLQLHPKPSVLGRGFRKLRHHFRTGFSSAARSDRSLGSVSPAPRHTKKSSPQGCLVTSTASINAGSHDGLVLPNPRSPATETSHCRSPSASRGTEVCFRALGSMILAPCLESGNLSTWQSRVGRCTAPTVPRAAD